MRKIGKKANMTDPIFLAVMLFSTFVALIIVVVVWNNMQAPLSNAINKSNTDNETIGMINEFHGKVSTGLNFFDYLAPLYLVGIIAMMIISAFFIKSHPIFFFISLFLLFIFVIVGVVLSNAYQDFIGADGINDTAVNFEITNTIMKYLPTIMMLSFFIIAFFLFAKSSPPPGGSI